MASVGDLEQMPDGNRVPDGSDMQIPEESDVLSTGVPFNLALTIERQSEIDGILAKNEANPEKAAQELNARIEGQWSDDYGISYSHISGKELPGLEIHGIAQKTALAGNHFPGANFEQADMFGSIFTATSMPELNARGANFNDSLFPMASIVGANLEDASAIDSVFTFADLTNTNVRGANFAATYLVGTKGLSGDADFTGARSIVLGEAVEQSDAYERLRNVLATRFSSQNAPRILENLDPVRIFRAVRHINDILEVQRLEGAVIDDAVLTNARLTGQDMTGAVWHRLHARGAVLRASRASGLVAIESSLQGADLSNVWLPGAVVVRSVLREANLSRANIAGTLIYETDLSKARLDNANIDGAIVIGGRLPGLSDEDRSRLTVVDSIQQLPPPVATAVMKFAAISLAASRSNASLEAGNDESVA